MRHIMSRYMGNKRAIAGRVLELLGPVERWTCYVEPFAGSLSVLEEARLAGYDGPVVIGERDHHIRAVWTTVRDRPDDLLAELDAIPRHINRETYKRLLHSLNVVPARDVARRAALVLFVVANGFNGLWRVNRSGLCNVAWSGRTAWTPPDATAVGLASKMLAGARIESDWARTREAGRKPGARVFADPPYQDTWNYSGAFDRTDRAALVRWLREVREHGRFVLSEQLTAGTQADFSIFEASESLDDAFGAPEVWTAARTCSRTVEGRGKVAEGLWTGGAA